MSRPQRDGAKGGADRWILVALGAVLLFIGLLHVTLEVSGGLVTDRLSYGLGKATVSAILLVVPGLLLVRRARAGRWLR